MEKKKALERPAHCGACAYYLTKPPRRQEIHSVPSQCSWRRSEKSLRRGVMQPDSTERAPGVAPAFNFRRPWRKWPDGRTDGRTDGGQAGRDAYDDRRTRRELTSQDGWARTRWTPCVRRARRHRRFHPAEISCGVVFKANGGKWCTVSRRLKMWR